MRCYVWNRFETVTPSPSVKGGGGTTGGKSCKDMRHFVNK